MKLLCTAILFAAVHVKATADENPDNDIVPPGRDLGSRVGELSDEPSILKFYRNDNIRCVTVDGDVERYAELVPEECDEDTPLFYFSTSERVVLEGLWDEDGNRVDDENLRRELKGGKSGRRRRRKKAKRNKLTESEESPTATIQKVLDPPEQVKTTAKRHYYEPDGIQYCIQADRNDEKPFLNICGKRSRPQKWWFVRKLTHWGWTYVMYNP